MKVESRRGWFGLLRVSALTAFVFVISMSSVDNASAAPFTSYLDDLIVELESRSAALEGSLIKEEIKLKKGIDKVLKKFVKDSSGPDKDLKNLAKAAKSLTKLFPEEMNPGKGGGDGNTLYDLVEAALANFDGDIQALLTAAQGVVDGAPPGKCKDKAQAVLDDVNEQLAALPGLPTLPDVAKALGKALKSVFKGQSLAEKALGCVPKLKWHINIAAATIEGTPYAFYSDSQSQCCMDGAQCCFDQDEIGSYLQFGGIFNITLGSGDGMFFMTLAIDTNSNTIFNSFITYDGGLYVADPMQSSVAVTSSLPGGSPKHVFGSFDLVAPGFGMTTGSITISGGSFGIYTYTD